MQMIFRDERPGDIAGIRTAVAAAFRPMPHSSQTEAGIVDALRAAGAITLSLVAREEEEIVGYIAFSPVMINGRDQGWYGLGPVAVRPDRQSRGIGQALVRSGLERLQGLGANGAVVLGEPEFYCRFGFQVYPQLRLVDVPPEYFLALPFAADIPSGLIEYHAAFAGA